MRIAIALTPSGETRGMIEAALTTRTQLRDFDPLYAGLVASWVRSDEELFMLAPSTYPPISANKVKRWTQQHGEPLMFVDMASRLPVGYAELNPMRRDHAQLWIGHVIVDPARRGQGLGLALTRALLTRAFDMHRAEKVTLVVFPKNHAAVACYHAAGMTVRGEETQRIEGRLRRCKLLRFEMDAEAHHRTCRAMAAQGSATLA